MKKIIFFLFIANFSIYLVQSQTNKQYHAIRTDTLTDNSIVFYKQEPVRETAEWDASPGVVEIKIAKTGSIRKLIHKTQIVGKYFPAFLSHDKSYVIFENKGIIYKFDPIIDTTTIIATGVFPHRINNLEKGFVFFEFDPIASKKKKFMEGENTFNVYLHYYDGENTKIGKLYVVSSTEDMGEYNPLAWVEIVKKDSNHVSFSGRGIFERVLTIP